MCPANGFTEVRQRKPWRANARSIENPFGHGSTAISFPLLRSEEVDVPRFELGASTMPR